jgi:hypothetical protein
VGGERAANLVALDDAMDLLGKLDPRKVQVVEMRFLAASVWKKRLRYSKYRQQR